MEKDEKTKGEKSSNQTGSNRSISRLSSKSTPDGEADYIERWSTSLRGWEPATPQELHVGEAVRIYIAANKTFMRTADGFYVFQVTRSHRNPTGKKEPLYDMRVDPFPFVNTTVH